MYRVTPTGAQRVSRQGMTLLELLVAMVILLVGIFTVARGFPLLLNTIRGESDRTSMARLAEKEMEGYSRNPEGMPDAVVGSASISPYDIPKDLTDLAEPNVEQDVVDVIGETFRVPAAYMSPTGTYAAGTSCQYALRQGPAQWTDTAGTSGLPYVYVLVPLTEQHSDPNAPGSAGLTANHFWVNTATGEITVPTTVAVTNEPNPGNSNTRTVDELVADYGWVETVTPGGLPTQHYVQGETVNDLTTSGATRVATVHAAHLPSTTFGQVLPGQTRVWAKHYLTREAFGVAYPSQPDHYVLENNYGATLRFHPYDTGLTLKVDYRLRTDSDGRRVLFMAEEQVVDSQREREDGSGNGYTDVRLSLRHVDNGADDPTGAKLFTNNARGNTALGTGLQTNVLAVDLVTGNTYIEGAGFSMVDDTLSPALEDGYRDGLLVFPLTISGAPADYLGHPMRFYYRTLDRHNLQLQRAPRAFVDRVTASAYQAAYLGYLADPQASEAASLAEVDYRTYGLSYAAAPSDPALRIGVLEFGQWLDEDLDPSTPPTWAEARNNAGMTVAVNYSYWGGSPAVQHFVYGELHTLPSGGGRVVLNRATLADSTSSSWDDYPITILAINGVSARSRAWWLTDKGNQKYLDIESCFLPTALGLLPRVQ